MLQQYPQQTTCTLPLYKLRQFYRLTPAQQHALLDIAAEMVAMNKERAESAPASPHLHAVK